MTASTSPSPSNRPRLAAFPKAFMQPLCKDGGMSVSDWITLASPLGVEGLEWYAGFLEMADEAPQGIDWSQAQAAQFRSEMNEDFNTPGAVAARYTAPPTDSFAVSIRGCAIPAALMLDCTPGR